MKITVPGECNHVHPKKLQASKKIPAPDRHHPNMLTITKKDSPGLAPTDNITPLYLLNESTHLAPEQPLPAVQGGSPEAKLQRGCTGRESVNYGEPALRKRRPLQCVAEQLGPLSVKHPHPFNTGWSPNFMLTL